MITDIAKALKRIVFQLFRIANSLERIEDYLYAECEEDDENMFFN